MRVELSVYMEVDDDEFNDLKRVVDHHIDWLLSLDEFPEITCVTGACLEKLDDDNDDSFIETD